MAEDDGPGNREGRAHGDAPRRFAEWLSRYGAAWEARDPAAAARLFSPDARYFWTPFEAPKEGPEGIAAAWREATGRQRNVRFRWQILHAAEDLGIAHWHTVLERAPDWTEVEIDGVLTAELEGDEPLCRVFREWWHSTWPGTARDEGEKEGSS